jgi:ADP-ribosyl-[dinitrogen reductase] hydrolase
MPHSHRLHAFQGALIADALSMPVHWYYDRLALRRDYGRVDRFLPPHNPHPNSILHRSSYIPVSPTADILHDQAKYWGQEGVHYHQHLRAGENTLNFQLARALYRQIRANGRYDSGAWLRLYCDCMRLPGWHRDTYVEEYHRAFFTNLARGKKPEACGIGDIHIGGLVPVAALFAALDDGGENLVRTVKDHVALTHNSPELLETAAALVRILQALESGTGLREAIEQHASGWVGRRKMQQWLTEPDEVVVGERLSPACYIKDAFPAALYLSWKYAEDFTAGIIANAHCGGDNCHRGAVVGPLLAFANGIPERWLEEPAPKV